MRRAPLAAALIALVLAGCRSEPAVEPRARADGNYLKGTTAYLKGDFDEALAAFAEVKKDAPDDPRLPAAIGEVYLSQGKLQEALEQFQAATRRDPGRATSWSRLGFIQATLGDGEAAAASLRRALELNPKDFNALEAQADLEVRQGAPERAAALLAAAARVGPADRQGEWVLRAVKLLEDQGKRAEAEALLADAVDAGTQAPEVHASLGERAVRRGDFTAAAAAFERAAAHAPDEPAYWELVGQLYQRLDRLDDAEAAYRKSLAIENRALVHVALARLALLRSNKEAAHKELELALATAKGEEIRETLDLSELLADLDLEAQALTLLEHHASAEDGQRDAELQRRTAELAHRLGKADTVKGACARLASLDAGTPLCR